VRTPSPLRNIWFRALLRGLHYSDRHQQFDTLYKLENPWSMDSLVDQARCQQTNELITREFGHVGRLFELGSGEGHQSCWLLRVCDNLYGREISTRAVIRARKRCPEATFTIGDLGTSLDEAEKDPFDLVVACEVLYYMSDPQAAVARLSSMGRACLVTYFHTQQERIEREVTFPAGANRSTIRHADVFWNAVWWRNGQEADVQAR
jgi:SAM-dependent methyltransferase